MQNYQLYKTGILPNGIKYLYVPGGAKLLVYLPGVTDCISDVTVKPWSRAFFGLPCVRSHSLLLVSRRVFENDRFTLDDYVKDTVESIELLVRKFERSSIDLAGASFAGGPCAVLAAPLLSVATNSVSVLCGGTSISPRGRELIGRARQLLMDDQVPKMLRAFSDAMFHRPLYKLMFRLLAGPTLTGSLTPLVRRNLVRVLELIAEFDVSRGLARLTAPVQFINGQHDAILSINTQFALHPCQLDIIPGVGHAAAVEAQCRFGRAYVKFLRKNQH